MAFDALAEVRADDSSVDASEPQLWPGHFDPAIEMGAAERRPTTVDTAETLLAELDELIGRQLPRESSP